MSDTPNTPPKSKTGASPDKGEAVALADKLVSPEEHYDQPLDVVIDPTLSLDDKTTALDNWELNERMVQVASDEGMTGGTPNRLDEVGEAKSKLGLSAISKDAR
jgi:hypothetical protein